MKPKQHLLALAVLSCLLAASGCKPGAEDDKQAIASGEVLEGSISDAMLPLETVTSTAPAARPVTSAPEPSDDATPESDETASAPTATLDQ